MYMAQPGFACIDEISTEGQFMWSREHAVDVTITVQENPVDSWRYPPGFPAR